MFFLHCNIYFRKDSRPDQQDQGRRIGFSGIHVRSLKKRAEGADENRSTKKIWEEDGKILWLIPTELK